MKLFKYLYVARCFALAWLSLGLAGCQTATLPVGNGFEEVSHPSHALNPLLDEPPPPRISFQYRNADGSVTKIWPSLYGVGEVIHGHLAIFVADKAYLEPDRATHPRLFAVEPPQPPLDITDEVLRRWSQAANRNFTRARDQFSLVTPEERSGRLALRLDFSPGDTWATAAREWPDHSTLLLDWRQVADIMQTVKTNGVEQKDLHWQTAYIGEKP